MYSYECIFVNITKKTCHKYILQATSYFIYFGFFFFISPTEALLLILDECKTELSEILVVILKQDYEA